MFSKSLHYYRLEKGMRPDDLAMKCDLDPLLITAYERAECEPDMEILKKLAAALEIRVSDFLRPGMEGLVFEHEDSLKKAALAADKQERLQEATEDYFSRLFTVLAIRKEDCLPPAPACHLLSLREDTKANADQLRNYLGLDKEALKNLTALLEEKGFLIRYWEENPEEVSLHGRVNGRPYIVISGKRSSESYRLTLASELVSLLFVWPAAMDPEKAALQAERIARCFLASKRAEESKQPDPEKPALFEKLVLRAVQENQIGLRRGAELLDITRWEMAARSRLDLRSSM